MNTIISELITDGYNITSTDKENIYLFAIGYGFDLVMDTMAETKNWTAKKDDDVYPWKDVPEANAKNNANDVINKYSLIKLDSEVDDSKFSVGDEDRGYKSGGYHTMKEAVFEEVEPPKTILPKKPGRRIKGLTPRLAEKGKIKIGIKGQMVASSKGNEFRKPKKVDYFYVTTMEKTKEDDFEEDPVIMKVLRDRAGEENDYKCRAIPVRLPYDDYTLNFPTCYAYYEGSLRLCQGDGEIALTNDGNVIDCNPETCKLYKNNQCKPNGTLSVILDDAPLVGGVYKFRTVGWNSINNLIASMEFIRGLTNGILAGLPLMLTLTPKHTTVPGTKIPTTIYMVNLEYRGTLHDMVNAIQQTMNTRALMQYSVKDFEKLAEEALALPEAPDECKAIVEEFYPEAVKGV